MSSPSDAMLAPGSDTATESLYIAGQICADSSRFDVHVLRKLASSVDAEAATRDNVESMSRDEVCGWLNKRTPWTWNSVRLWRTLTNVASRLALTASKVLLSIRNRLSTLVSKDRVVRAAYDSKNYEHFLAILDNPPASVGDSLRTSIARVQGLLDELQAMQRVENRFTMLRWQGSAGWFGSLSAEEKVQRESLTKYTTRLLHILREYLARVDDAVASRTSLMDQMQALRQRLTMVEAALQRNNLM